MTKEFVGYAFQKTLATGFIDMALLLANVSQLKILTEQEMSTPNFKTICAIFLVVVSIMLQVAVGCILIYLGKEENKAMSNVIVVTKETDNQSSSGNSASTGDTVLNMMQTDIRKQNSYPEMYKIQNEAVKSFPDMTSNTINEKDGLTETNNKINGTDEVDKVSQLGLDVVDGIYVIDREANTIHAIRQPSPTPSRVSPTDTLDRHKDVETGALEEFDHIGNIHKKHSNTNAHVMCCVFIIMIINIVLSGMGLGISDGQTVRAILNGTNP